MPEIVVGPHAADAASEPGDVEPDHVDPQEALMQFLYRAPIGLVQMAADGTIEMANPKAAQLLMPIAQDGDLGNFFSLFDADAPQLRALGAAFRQPHGPVCEGFRVSVADPGGGAPRILSIDLTKLDAARSMAVIADATHEAERERLDVARQLRHAARVDVLTRMPNRVALIEQVQDVIDREPLEPGYAFALLFINCDRFTEINAAFGHAIGDEILALMAGRIRAEVRPSDRVGRTVDTDRMAARIAGDEFVVLLEHLSSPMDVHVVADRLLKAIGMPYRVDARPVHCNVSIGVVVRAHVVGDADRLLQDASIAMRAAKRDGGGRHVLFDPAMRLLATRRGSIEADLRSALALGQLFVVYQPVVGFRGDGSVDRTAGVEALVRWRHPERGIVPPADFIDIAEETGLIGAVGEFVLDSACRQFVAWQAGNAATAPRMVAVNASRAQLASVDFVGTVARMLETFGMRPECLQIEITESLAAQDETIQCHLHALRALGVTVALDDFGTGFSSLSSLHLLAVDTVKIDRSFVSLADSSAHHRVLIEATVRVARSLGMRTVAEGIETEAQAAVIRELGCDKGQGYLYSRPLAAEALGPWMVEACRTAAIEVAA